MPKLCIWDLDLQLRRMFEARAAEPVPAHLLALANDLEARLALGGGVMPDGVAEPLEPGQGGLTASAPAPAQETAASSPISPVP